MQRQRDRETKIKVLADEKSSLFSQELFLADDNQWESVSDEGAESASGMLSLQTDILESH